MHRRQYAMNCFDGAETLMTVLSFKCLSASCLCAADPPIWSTSFLRFHKRLASSAFMTAGDYNAQYKVQSFSALFATSAGAVTRAMGRGDCRAVVQPCIDKQICLCQLAPARRTCAKDYSNVCVKASGVPHFCIEAAGVTNLTLPMCQC